MKLDSKSELAHLKVDGGMTTGDLVMEVPADVGGFEVVRPEMRESIALGLALLAASAVGLFGWDITRPETFGDVNTTPSTVFAPRTTAEERGRAWHGWQRAVERSRGWIETAEERSGRSMVAGNEPFQVRVSYGWVLSFNFHFVIVFHLPYLPPFFLIPARGFRGRKYRAKGESVRRIVIVTPAPSVEAAVEPFNIQNLTLKHGVTVLLPWMDNMPTRKWCLRLAVLKSVFVRPFPRFGLQVCSCLSPVDDASRRPHFSWPHTQVKPVHWVLLDHHRATPATQLPTSKEKNWLGSSGWTSKTGPVKR